MKQTKNQSPRRGGQSTFSISGLWWTAATITGEASPSRIIRGDEYEVPQGISANHRGSSGITSPSFFSFFFSFFHLSCRLLSVQFVDYSQWHFLSWFFSSSVTFTASCCCCCCSGSEICSECELRVLSEAHMEKQEEIIRGIAGIKPNIVVCYCRVRPLTDRHSQWPPAVIS